MLRWSYGRNRNGPARRIWCSPLEMEPAQRTKPVGRELNPAGQKLGIPWLSWHVFRHTHVTLGEEIGMADRRQLFFRSATIIFPAQRQLLLRRREASPWRRAVARPPVLVFWEIDQSGRWESGKPAFGFPLFHPPSSPELWKCGNLACFWRDFQGARGKSGKPAFGFPRFPQPRHFHSSLRLGCTAVRGFPARINKRTPDQVRSIQFGPTRSFDSSLRRGAEVTDHIHVLGPAGTHH